MPLDDEEKQEPKLTCAACGKTGTRGRDPNCIGVCLGYTQLCTWCQGDYMRAFETDAPSIDAERRRFFAWVEAEKQKRRRSA